jgi:hypothetical protein
MRAFLLGAIAAMGLAASASASTIIYSNDFESGSTGGFSGATTITTAPSNVTKFLGPLTAGSSADLALNTTGLSSITLGFDLYTLLSLDGDNSPGPDYFTVKVNGSAVLLNNTFTNNSGWTQTYGGVGSPGGTGSDPALTFQLGYDYYGPDHTYHLSYAVPVSGPSTVISFIGASDQAWGDEGFGIDNVVVDGTAAVSGGVPEPSAWATMLLGMFGLGAALRSARRRPQLTAA